VYDSIERNKFNKLNFQHYTALFWFVKHFFENSEKSPEILGGRKVVSQSLFYKILEVFRRLPPLPHPVFTPQGFRLTATANLRTAGRDAHYY